MKISLKHATAIKTRACYLLLCTFDGITLGYIAEDMFQLSCLIMLYTVLLGTLNMYENIFMCNIIQTATGSFGILNCQLPKLSCVHYFYYYYKILSFNYNK